jgi:hypothetical protein
MLILLAPALKKHERKKEHEREGRKVTRRKKPGETTERYFYIALPGEISRAPQVTLGDYGKESFPFAPSWILVIDTLFSFALLCEPSRPLR